jgi:hypothetical protein
MATESDPRIARYAALQSVTEIGLGSVVHGFHIPLGGHLLTLNQGVLLTFAVRPTGDRSVRFARKRGIFVATSVSFVTALLKFLSPAGARAMPALGISLQGIFYSAGIAVFGLNQVGVIVGFVFLSFWAFMHPIVFAYLIFGQTLFDAIVKLWTEIATKVGIPVEFGFWVLFGAVGLKALIAAGLAVFAWRADESREARYFDRIGKWVKKGTKAAHRISSDPDAPVAPSRVDSPALGATKDLLRPIFMVSLVFSIGFLFFMGKEPLSAIGYLARTIAVAWTIFFGIRAFPSQWAAAIQAKFPVLAETAEEVRRSRN